MSKDTVHEVCNVFITARDRRSRAVIAERVGHNVWTNTGREYSCLLKTYTADGRAPFRNDRIAYMGVGTGTQTEAVSVSRLVRPVPYASALFLKKVSHQLTTFPNNQLRTQVRYICTFDEIELTPPEGADIYQISECGLFTDGDQDTFAVGERDTGLNAAGLQSPIAYHTFDPIPKLPTLELEIIWELRH